MSQEIGATLLPPARVDFFASDARTADTAQALSNDWRFARVHVEIIREGIESAITRYSQTASPEVIVIETDDISQAFIERLTALAGYCAAGTDAVVIGPQNDVHLYRDLVGMGVRDYLVRPVSFDEIAGVISKSLIDKKGLGSSRLVSVIGAKGGVGTTAMAQLLAVTLSETLDQRTVFLEAAGSISTAGVALGLEPLASLTETARIVSSGSDDDIKRIVQKSTDHLSVLLSGGDAMLNDRPDADGMEAVINRLMQKNPLVIADLSCALPAVQKRFLTRSAHIIVVSTPMIAALRNARTLMRELKTMRAGLQHVDAVVNMQGAADGYDVSMSDIAKVLEKEPAVKIPFLPKLFMEAEVTGKVTSFARLPSDVQKSLMALAARAGAVAEKSLGEGAAAPVKSNPADMIKSLFKKK